MPWGRSLSEYVRMFDLTATDLASTIVDCAAGPSSFNADMRGLGRAIVSCDPIYNFSGTEISDRIEEIRGVMLEATRESKGNFIWDEYQTPERLVEIRLQTMRTFLADFPTGRAGKRYRPAELPNLPFLNCQFDLAICSHFLFTYSALLDSEFHLASLREMCRVAKEVRVFPILEQFGSEHSRHVVPVVEQLSEDGYRCDVMRVAYEFQKGGNEMLRIRRIPNHVTR